MYEPYLTTLFGFMPLWLFVTIIVVVVIGVLLFLLYRYATKLQKQQADAQDQIQANTQTVSMLVIDKKRMKMKESGLPQMVIDETPKYLRNAKLPIVKAKVGPRITNLVCDEKIFDQIPGKKESKAGISGIYIVSVKGLRANLEAKPQKVGFFKRMRNKLIDKNAEAMAENAKIVKENEAAKAAKKAARQAKKEGKKK